MNRFAAAAAFAALAFSASVNAQEEMSPQAAQAAVRYALPHLLSGVRTACGPKLSSSGYLARNGAELLTRYSQGSEAAWPAARDALIQLGGKKDANMAQMFSQMPDSALKPFVDATISSMIASKLKVEDCGDIERALELIAPLPPENVAGLAGFIFEMTERADKAKGAAGG
jgi:hypothetical protein